jgi:hypothetical protein
MIHNRQLYEDSPELLNDKPIFLFALPKSDRNGGLLATDIDQLMVKYNVVLFTWSSAIDLRRIYGEALSKNVFIPYREIG